MENQIKASFDVSTEEGQIRVLNAQAGASQSMKSVEDGKVIPVTAILQYPEKTDEYGKDQDVLVTTLFTDDGEVFSSISETVASSAGRIMDFMKKFNKEVLNVKIVKQKSRNGQEFINLQIAM